MKLNEMTPKISLTGKSFVRIVSTSSHRHKKLSIKESTRNQLSFRWWTQPSTFSIRRPSLIWSASPFSLFLWIHSSLLWRKRKNGTIHYVLFACTTPASCHRPASFYLNQKYRKAIMTFFTYRRRHQSRRFDAIHHGDLAVHRTGDPVHSSHIEA